MNQDFRLLFQSEIAQLNFLPYMEYYSDYTEPTEYIREVESTHKKHTKKNIIKEVFNYTPGIRTIK